VNEVAKKLLTISDKNAKVEHLDAIKDEVLYNSLDNRLIKQELGWEPLVGLEEGLKRTFTWFKNFQ
jgi:nucleoside-diphosphate-sugar epimerase